MNQHNMYDNSDSQLDSPVAIPVDTNGICYVARIVDDVSCIDRIEECNDNSESEDDNFDNNTNNRKPTLKWRSTDRCKPLLESDVSSIIEVRRYFDEPIKELRKHLDACDNCPNNHYEENQSSTDEEREQSRRIFDKFCFSYVDTFVEDKGGEEDLIKMTTVRALWGTQKNVNQYFPHPWNCKLRALADLVSPVNLKTSKD